MQPGFIESTVFNIISAAQRTDDIDAGDPRENRCVFLLTYGTGVGAAVSRLK
jgi:hypothetical protein